MSADNLGSALNSGSDHVVRRRDDSAQPFRQGRSINDGEANDGDFHGCSAALFMLRPPPSGVSIFVSVTVTEYISRFSFFLNVRKIAAMHQNDDRLDFVDVRFGERHDTALGAWKKHWLLFHRKGATFRRQTKRSLICRASGVRRSVST